MAPQKGKQGTKGQKQIVEENKQTIKFYSFMAVGALIVHLIAHLVLWRDSITLSYTLLFLFSMLVYGGCIQTMRYMARASYSETGQLLDGGLDLNMAQAGMGEHLKDLIILTACIQTLSLASTYIWFLWLVAPAYAFYLLWVNVLGPWVFQPAPPEVDDKKQKKLERKSRRHWRTHVVCTSLCVVQNRLSVACAYIDCQFSKVSLSSATCALQDFVFSSHKMKCLK